MLGGPDYSDARFEFTGHADTRGAAATNQVLSLQRAEAIRERIVAMKPGLAGRISVLGRGEEQPRSYGQSESDHKANRRLEVRMLR